MTCQPKKTWQPKNLSFSELESFYQTSIGVLFAKLFNLTTVSDPRKGSLSKIQKYFRDFIELIKVVSCCELIYVLVNRIKILKFVSIHFITTQVTFWGKHSYPVGEHQIIFFSKTRDDRGKGILIKNILISSSYR